MTGISSLLNAPLYTGSSANVTTPRPYPVAINGHGYIPDFSIDSRRETFRHLSIEMLRSQADTSNVPGQQSLNPAGLWRRSQETWHGGAGQRYFDRVSDVDASSFTRFWTSKGVDVWTKWQLTLLNETVSCRSSGNVNLFLQSVGSRLYLTENQSLYFATSAAGLATPTTVTGVPAATITSICSDGFNVYVACTASGLYTTNRGSGAATQLVTSALSANSLCRYVKGRLIVSKDNSIYNVISPTAAVLPATPLLTHPNTDFVWVGAAPSKSHILCAGYSGDKSLIYKTSVKADGTALDTLVVCGELPDGEVITSLDGYLGLLVVGTTKGVRIGEVDAEGDVVFGDLGDVIPTESPVKCFEPQDRFVWYGLTNYDSVSTGLGRIDLRTRNGNAPAYASDLMTTGQGDVTSVVTFQDERVFAVAGLGVFHEVPTKVASGTIDSGLMSFGIGDPKVGVFMHYDTAALVGSIEGFVSRDNGAFVSIGDITIVGSVGTDLPVVQALTNSFEVRTVLNRASGADTVGPTVVRGTLRVNPAASTGYNIIVPIRLAEELLVGGVDTPLVPSAERAFLDELRINRRVVIYQEGAQSFTVTVEGIDWLPESLGRENAEMNGVAVITMKTLV